MTQTIYLSLGSNLGDRVGNLRAALTALEGVAEIEKVSSLYETEPVGVVDQPAFLNLAVRGSTQLSPGELLEALKRIERDVGRVPSFRWGPRVVDVDILMYGDLVVDSPDLTIPHKEMMNRAFVLVPLAEIAPESVHPRAGQAVEELRKAIDDSGVRTYQLPKRSSAHGSASM